MLTPAAVPSTGAVHATPTPRDRREGEGVSPGPELSGGERVIELRYTIATEIAAAAQHAGTETLEQAHQVGVARVDIPAPTRSFS
jgi:hypothetical protein